mmetsp:Transcript_25185/g.32859  ORF Transcript_25185/g.32859 Transcript_25185/m.32859 type:complete len:513 (-) Transcript_25185:280-1818(-)
MELNKQTENNEASAKASNEDVLDGSKTKGDQGSKNRNRKKKNKQRRRSKNDMKEDVKELQPKSEDTESVASEISAPSEDRIQSKTSLKNELNKEPQNLSVNKKELKDSKEEHYQQEDNQNEPKQNNTSDKKVKEEESLKEKEVDEEIKENDEEDTSTKTDAKGPEAAQLEEFKAVECEVTGWTDIEVEGKRTFYNLLLHNAKNSQWTLNKSYTEFFELHKRLKEKNSVVSGFDFPGKTVVIGGTKEKRRNVFEEYSNLVLKLLPDDKDLYAFFKPPEGVQPVKKKEVTSEVKISPDPFAKDPFGGIYSPKINTERKIKSVADTEGFSCDESIWNFYAESRGPFVNTFLFVMMLVFTYAFMLRSTSVFTYVEDLDSEDALKVLSPGYMMNSSQYLTNGCQAGNATCTPHLAYLTPDCNFVLVEGAAYSEDAPIVWESDSQKKCAFGKCKNCDVTLNAKTGVLSVVDGKKTRWQSRKPKKASQIQGNFSVSITSVGKLVIMKGNQTMITIAHPQ